MDRAVAAIFSIGASLGGAPYALEKLLEDETALHVYLLYGEPAPTQKEDPASVCAALRNDPRFEKVSFKRTCSVRPFDPDLAYQDILQIVREVRDEGYQRVYLGITGGTKPMVAALFHLGMTELTCEVLPVYTQGVGAVPLRYFKAGATRQQIVLERVLQLARQCHLPLARVLVKELPATGPAGFVRKAIEAFADWDDFRYQEAAPKLTELHHAAQYQPKHLAESGLARTLRRYASIAAKVSLLASDVASLDKLRQSAADSGWAGRVRKEGMWLPADALANAHRRHQEGRYSDAVIRAYRACEIAMHNRLFEFGIHPSGVDWDLPALSAIRADFQPEPPRELTFERGVQLLELLQGSPFPSSHERRDLQSTRNHCYLEHGYIRVSKSTSDKLLLKACRICAELLGCEPAHFQSLVKTLEFQF